MKIKRLRRSWQLISQGIVSSIALMKLGQWSAFPRFGLAVWNLATDKTARATKHLWWRRSKTCLACPLFDPKWMTCGTPGETWENPATKEVEPLGCWCGMLLLKNWFKRATCWSKDHAGDYGWSE